MLNNYSVQMGQGNSPVKNMFGIKIPEITDFAGLSKQFGVPDLSQYNIDQNSIMQMIQKLFGQGQSNLYGTMQNAGSGAGRNAFAQGQSMGLSNPFSLQQRARNSTMSNFAPQFGGMEENRLNTLSNLPFQVNQFNSGLANQGFQNQMTLKNYMLQKQQLDAQIEAQDEAGKWWNTILPMILGAGGKIGGALLSGGGGSSGGSGGFGLKGGSGYSGGTGMNTYIPHYG
jgi:hypothetical protein